ncbi:MAG: VOC family protein [Bernardetiaceae bacterium]|jgi:uncharacterized glyoxalase superfamily protein PhnB|nr:VOC family protein [Bernardetiaceae bacterium]
MATKQRGQIKWLIFSTLALFTITAFASLEPTTQPPQYQSLGLRLTVRNVEKSLKFYQERLGFEVLQKMRERGTMNYALLKAGGATLALQTEQKLKEDFPQLKNPARPGPNLNLILKVDDAATLFAQLRKGTEVVKPLETTFYGASEFTLRDPDGYLITFQQLSE